MAKRQIMVETQDRQNGGLGHSDYTVLTLMFPGSPIFSGELTDDIVTETFMSIVTNAVVNDDGYMFGEVDLNYGQSPNLEEVVVGGGGLPGSPWAPNIAVPPVGQNPADIPASGVEATERAKGGGGAFIGDGLASPSATSATISGQTVNNVQLGTSTPVGGQ